MEADKSSIDTFLNNPEVPTNNIPVPSHFNGNIKNTFFSKKFTPVIFIMLSVIIIIGLIGWLYMRLFNIKGTDLGDTKIRFTINEGFTKEMDGPHLFLDIATQTQFACSNYELENKTKTEDNLITVTLGDISKPQLCLTSIGPATSKKELKIKEGEYKIIIQNKNFEDEYMLYITEENIILKLRKSNFSQIAGNNIKRLPKYLIWADCFWNGDWRLNPYDNFCTDFFNEIRSIAKPYLVPEKEKISKNQFYHYYGLEKPLVDLINKYNRKGYYVKIDTWQGKSYICRTHLKDCNTPQIAYIPLLQLEYLEEPKSDISKCRNDDVICVSEVASKLKDESLCIILPLKDQGQCFGNVGVAKLDTALCDKTNQCISCRDSCYESIAIKQSRPEICEKTSTLDRPGSSDSCYFDYALAKDNISICDLINREDTKNSCRERFQ